MPGRCPHFQVSLGMRRHYAAAGSVSCPAVKGPLAINCCPLSSSIFADAAPAWAFYLCTITGDQGLLMSGGFSTTGCTPATPNVTAEAFVRAALAGVASRQLSINKELQLSLDWLQSYGEESDEGAEERMLDEVRRVCACHAVTRCASNKVRLVLFPSSSSCYNSSSFP